MADQTASPPAAPAAPAQAEVTISAEEYMERYAHDFYEWVKGRLIKMSPVTDIHDLLTGYLYQLFAAYFALNPVGVIRRAPFVMRTDVTESRREPDLQIILKTNPGQLTPTAMIGPADICMEVVSLESVSRDHGEKYEEYEKGGVREYWIFDPIHRETRFNRLNDQKVYLRVEPDADGFYQTPLLPGLRIHTPTLWQDPLPDFFEIGQAVRDMLGK